MPVAMNRQLQVTPLDAVRQASEGVNAMEIFNHGMTLHSTVPKTPSRNTKGRFKPMNGREQDMDPQALAALVEPLAKCICALVSTFYISNSHLKTN